MRAYVDVDLCTGCGLCVDICPDVFAMEGDLATVIVEPVPTEDIESCIEAEESCPVEAIGTEE